MARKTIAQKSSLVRPNRTRDLNLLATTTCQQHDFDPLLDLINTLQNAKPDDLSTYQRSDSLLKAMAFVYPKQRSVDVGTGDQMKDVRIVIGGID
ncbi:MAG: hypothetical protein ACR2OJ_14215 [Hyphomicrobiales bacterium]